MSAAGVAAPAIRPDLFVADVDDGLVIYDPLSRTSHVLNITGRAFWAACDGQTPVDDIATRLASSFTADEASVRSDLVRLVDELSAVGLLQGAPCPPRAAVVRPQLPAPSAHYRRLAQIADQHTWEWVSPPLAAIDFRFRLVTDDALLARFLPPVLDSLTTDETSDHLYIARRSGPGNTRLRLTLDGRRVRQASDAPALATHLLWHINRLAVEASPRLVLLHAAGAQGPEGTVLLPAQSEAGKSTLVADLVRHGLTYLSDEAVGIEPSTLRAHAYRKALTIDRGAWALLDQVAPAPDGELAPFHVDSWQVPPTALGSTVTSTSPSVDAIVFPRYEPGAATRVTNLSATDTLTHLLSNAFDFPALGQAGLDTLAELARTTPAWTLVSGRLADARSVVLDLLTSRTASG